MPPPEQAATRTCFARQGHSFFKEALIKCVCAIVDELINAS